VERVLADVRDGKVSIDGARDDYGVVVGTPRSLVRSAPKLSGDPAPAAGARFEGDRASVRVDMAATAELRDRMRRSRTERWHDGRPPFFDRGPGYLRLSGRAHSELDIL
jgi:N-methylhydantoinase B